VLLIGLLVVLITVTLGGGAHARDLAPAADAARPSLAIMDLQPLTVSGRGFKTGERVIVSTGTSRKATTANTAGRFVVRFTRVTCAAHAIVAVGSKGSRATTRPPQILCVSP
jgi:hypothetical protein